MTRLLIFLGIFLLAEYYAYIVVRSAMRTLPQNAKTIMTVVYILLTIVTWAGFLSFRFIDWAKVPHLLRNIYIAFTMGFILGKAIILIVMLGDEVRRFFVWIWSIFSKPAIAATSIPEATGTGISRSIFIQRTALLLGGTMLGGFLYGITNRYNYRIRRVQLSFKNLPAAFKGMKIVQISDVHSGSFDSHHAVQKGVERIMDEKPDIIFFTGDLVNNKADEIQPYTDIFSKLSAPMGVYSTLGNHDYGDYVQWPSADAKRKNLDWLKETHGKMGWRLLMNEHVVLEKGDDKIAIVGIENWGAKGPMPF